MTKPFLHAVNMQGDTHNDTELDTWQPLAAVTTRLLNKALETPFADAGGAAKASGRSEDDGNAPDAGGSGIRQKQRDEQREEYVQTRIKELREFERRASGKAPRSK